MTILPPPVKKMIYNVWRTAIWRTTIKSWPPLITLHLDSSNSICLRVIKYYLMVLKWTPLRNNITLTVENMLPHPLHSDVDYSQNRVVQKRTWVLKDAVARMILQNVSPCIVATFWAQVASAIVRHAASSWCLKRFFAKGENVKGVADQLHAIYLILRNSNLC